MGGSRVWWSLVAEPAEGSWQLCHLYQVCVRPRHPAVSPWNRLTSSSSRGQILCDLPLLPRWQSPICEEQGPPPEPHPPGFASQLRLGRVLPEPRWPPVWGLWASLAVRGQEVT